MVKLDQKDLQILSILDRNSRRPLRNAAKEAKIPVSVMKYRVERLEKIGVIKKFIPVINYSLFGYNTFKVFVQFQNTHPSDENAIYTFIKKEKSVNYLAILSGNWDIVFGVVTRTIPEFDVVFNRFMNKFSCFVLRTETSINVEVEIYPRSYLDEPGQYLSVPFKQTDKRIVLEKFSYSILNQLRNNSRLSVVKIARDVNSTPRKVSYKLKEMEKKGIILLYKLDLNHDLLNLEFFKVFIRTNEYTFDKDREFRKFCKNQPSCVHLVKVLGRWNYELEFEIRNGNDLHEILKVLRTNFSGFIRAIAKVQILKEEKFEFLPFDVNFVK